MKRVPSSATGLEVHEDHSPGDEVGGETEDLRRELDALRDENQALQEQVSGLEHKLEEGKVRFRELWRTVAYDTMITAKDLEIEELGYEPIQEVLLQRA